MSELATVGIDLAKSVFQIHGVDGNGRVLVRRQLRRSQLLVFFQKRPRCLIGMEACAGSHDWGRRLLEMGHDVRLMPPSYVKPYVKLGETSRMGERTLRRLLIIGASAAVRWAMRKGKSADPWLMRILGRKPPMLVIVALANKTARIVWALMAKGGTYRAPAVAG
ncbi:hypothetical protein NKH65_31090 [Mesorhizobium australicum]